MMATEKVLNSCLPALRLILSYFKWTETVRLRRVNRAFKQTVEERIRQLRRVKTPYWRERDVPNYQEKATNLYQFLDSYAPNLTDLQSQFIPRFPILSKLQRITLIVDGGSSKEWETRTAEDLKTRMPFLKSICFGGTHFYGADLTIRKVMEGVEAPHLELIGYGAAWARSILERILPDDLSRSAPKLRAVHFPYSFYRGVYDDFNALNGCKQLQQVILPRLVRPDPNLNSFYMQETLFPIPQLEHLTMGEWQIADPEMWKQLYRGCGSLMSLELTPTCYPLQITHLKEATSLRKLEVAWTDWNKAYVDILLEALDSMPFLTTLSLKLPVERALITLNKINESVRSLKDFEMVLHHSHRYPQASRICIRLNRPLRKFRFHCKLANAKLTFSLGGETKSSLEMLEIDWKPNLGYWDDGEARSFVETSISGSTNLKSVSIHWLGDEAEMTRSLIENLDIPSLKDISISKDGPKPC